MEDKNLRCLRCDTEMLFAKREDIQLGKQSFWHDWNHLLHGSLDVDIYVCPKCGRIEFFAPGAALDSIRTQTQAAKHEAKPGETVAKKCAECGRIVSKAEKYCPVCGETALLLPQVKCPVCGALHDFDDPKCPSCKN